MFVGEGENLGIGSEVSENWDWLPEPQVDMKIVVDYLAVFVLYNP